MFTSRNLKYIDSNKIITSPRINALLCILIFSSVSGHFHFFEILSNWRFFILVLKNHIEICTEQVHQAVNMRSLFTVHDIAIAIASYLGIILIPGPKVPGDGDCFITCALAQESRILYHRALVDYNEMKTS